MSHSLARAADRRLAIIVTAISAIAFAIVAPYATAQLPTVGLHPELPGGATMARSICCSPTS